MVASVSGESNAAMVVVQGLGNQSYKGRWVIGGPAPEVLAAEITG
jgi:hypothetical protein